MTTTTTTRSRLKFQASSNLTLKQNQNMGLKRGTTSRPSTQRPKCNVAGERQCEDGTCIPRIELCPEEQLMNQNTILIMIVVGLAVVVFLVILYCFQQRQRRANQALSVIEGTAGLTTENDSDNASLYAPPPTYDEVINTNLYPPTPEQQPRRQRMPSEEPMTPPPNYDAALTILAQSQESVLMKPKRQSSVFRRSVSLDPINKSSAAEGSSNGANNSNSTFTRFIFSRQMSANPATSPRKHSSQSGPRTPNGV